MADTEEEILIIPEDKQWADDDMAKLELLHSNRYPCDVVLSVGRREFPAHRILLAKKSDYFERMFNGGLKETNEEHVEIKGVDADLLQALVGHCYRHPISIPVSKLLDLHSAADMLQFPAVKKMCSNVIIDRLTTDNVINIYEFAKLFSAEKLKTTAVAYMRNHFRVVSTQEHFLDLEFEDLEVILSCEKLDIITEMDVFRSIETWCRHKQESREKHFPKLLTLIQSQHLPANVVVNDLATSPLVKSNLECMQVVMEYGVKHLQGVKKLHCVKQRSLHAGEDIFVIGGQVKQKVTSLVQKYSGSTKLWSSCPPITEARSKAVAAGYMDKIYVYGGMKEGFESVFSMEMFCRQKEVWRAVNAPKVARRLCGFCECEGWLYTIGGYTNFNSPNMKSAERYDPVRDEWHAIASMPFSLRNAFAVNHKDTVYIFGLDYDHRLATFLYDPRIDKFECGNRNMYRNDSYPQAAVSVHRDEISVIQDGCRTIDIFEPRQNRWQISKTNIKLRNSFAAVSYQDSAVVLGGYDGRSLCTDVSAFNRMGFFTTLTHLPSATRGCCAVVA